MKRYSVLYVIVVLFVSGCNRENTPKLIQKIDLISSDFSKDWFIKSTLLTFTEESKIKPNSTALVLDCEIDDKWTFYRSGKLEIRDQQTKCKGLPDLKVTSSWFPDDTFNKMNFLEFKLGGITVPQSITFEVTELSDSTMTLTANKLSSTYESFQVKFKTR